MQQEFQESRLPPFQNNRISATQMSDGPKSFLEILALGPGRGSLERYSVRPMKIQTQLIQQNLELQVRGWMGEGGGGQGGGVVKEMLHRPYSISPRPTARKY